MLSLNVVLSAIIKYFVMLTMNDGVPDFFYNLNMFFMALMLAPMTILMLMMMGSMYRNRGRNLAIGLGLRRCSCWPSSECANRPGSMIGSSS